MSKASASLAVSTRRVLITDDDPSLRTMLGALCTRHGYTCDMAVDGAEAFSKLRSAPYDLLLLDLMMPRMNGFELIRMMGETRTDESQPAVVILTAQPIPANTRAILEAGFVHAVLAKPFDFDDLLRVMERSIAESARPASAALADPAKG